MLSRDPLALLSQSVAAAPITIFLILISASPMGVELSERARAMAEVVYYVASGVGVVASIYGLVYSRSSYKIAHGALLLWQGYAHLVYIRLAPIPWLYAKSLLS